MKKGTPPAYPDVYNAGFADAYNNFVVPKMAQRVVIDSWDFDRAMDEAQSADPGDLRQVQVSAARGAADGARASFAARDCAGGQVTMQRTSSH